MTTVIIKDQSPEDILSSLNEDLLSFLQTRCPPGWESVFLDPQQKWNINYIWERIKDMSKGCMVFPVGWSQVFKMYFILPPEKIRIVILGQDPYHLTYNGGIDTTLLSSAINQGNNNLVSFQQAYRKLFTDGMIPYATGPAFSDHKDAPVPMSLLNIFKELEQEYAQQHARDARSPLYIRPTNGDLIYWMSQGVFLLNSALTLNAGDAGSHKAIWSPVITATIECILKASPKTLFLLWGANAQNFRSTITRLGGKALECPHPTSRNPRSQFLGCGHFLHANEYLLSIGQKPIDWQL
jgi:uracil-DNA glycosylase